MSDPFLVVQISDPHVGADWGIGDPVALLSAAVGSACALEPRVDAVLVSGDLADHATDAEYELVKELLAPLDAPIYVLPGNHDDRDALRRHFGVPGTVGEPVQYAADLGPLRLVVLDTTRPGADPGELDPGRLAWLEETLGAAPETPTILAMHHAPITTGVPAIDEVGLSLADRRALGGVIRRHPQILRIAAGHLHRTVAASLGERTVLAAPSTYVQTRLRFGSHEDELTNEPAGFVVHALIDGELSSHVQPVV